MNKADKQLELTRCLAIAIRERIKQNNPDIDKVKGAGLESLSFIIDDKIKPYPDEWRLPMYVDENDSTKIKSTEDIIKGH